MNGITPDFFTRDPVDCARELIGCRFHWKGCVGRIVETEAYRAIGDEACHTFFRPSVREFVSRSKPGDAYVYLNYGVHWLFNIVVKGGAQEGFVLIRALEPVGGIGEMVSRTGKTDIGALANGPGKLTKALGITGEAHGTGFLTEERCGIFPGQSGGIVIGPRVGISKAKDLPWRFGERGSRFVSKVFSGCASHGFSYTDAHQDL